MNGTFDRKEFFQRLMRLMLGGTLGGAGYFLWKHGSAAQACSQDSCAGCTRYAGCEQRSARERRKP